MPSPCLGGRVLIMSAAVCAALAPVHAKQRHCGMAFKRDFRSVRSTISRKLSEALFLSLFTDNAVS